LCCSIDDIFRVRPAYPAKIHFITINDSESTTTSSDNHNSETSNDSKSTNSQQQQQQQASSPIATMKQLSSLTRASTHVISKLAISNDELDAILRNFISTHCS